MPRRSGIIIQSPNQSDDHSILIELAESNDNDITAADIKIFLWKINASSQLESIVLIAINILETIEMWESLIELPGLEDWNKFKSVCQFIICNKDVLIEKIGKHIYKSDTNTFSHPYLYWGLSRHPFCATMCNTSKNKELRLGYVFFRFPVLFAHITLVNEYLTQEQYESTDMTDGHSSKELHNKIYAVCKAYRDWSENNNDLEILEDASNEIKDGLELFDDFIELVDEIISSDLTDAKSYFDFIQNTFNPVDPSEKKGGGGNGGVGGSFPVTGYVEFEEEAIFINALDCDLEGPVHEIQRKNNSPERDNLLEDTDLDEDDIDDDTHKNLLFSYSCQHKKTDYLSLYLAAKGRANAEIIENQLLPSSLNILTNNEISNIVYLCESRLIELRDKLYLTKSLNNKDDMKVYEEFETLLFTVSLLLIGQDKKKLIYTLPQIV